ncbi:hypothetical protein PDJAM_G00118580 [Pangasius djambal]|uniref:Uncharacterized protein n=1 Tax=Pangasius djambal TaxID=1691987 RepID=A0ACC5Z8Q5_9TELE|nr:hypothetical protein [Pangasius djambal]
MPYFWLEFSPVGDRSLLLGMVPHGRPEDHWDCWRWCCLGTVEMALDCSSLGLVSGVVERSCVEAGALHTHQLAYSELWHETGSARAPSLHASLGFTDC